MSIPTKYKYLESINPLPKFIATALKYHGLQEVVGKGSNKTIIEWRDELNQNNTPIVGYSDDDIPWCGLFVAYVVYKTGRKPVANPLWARNWANFGNASTKASLGDILVFVRNGGGHVGFYVGEDKTAYHVLGGNQSNSVSITRILKSRCVAVRSPQYNSRPDTAKPIYLTAGGQISSNEA